jgi:hypothetical protein
MRLHHVVLPLALILAAGGAKAADTPTMTASSVSDLASLFEGEFTTLPDRGGTKPASDKVIYNLAKRVRVPALGQDVVYAEQHENAVGGPMLWQRLYAFVLDTDLGLIVMTPYDFSNGQQLAGAYSDPTPLAKLEPTALKPQPDGCIVLWHRAEMGFEGALKPGSCKNAPAAPKTAGAPAITVTKTDYTEQPQDGSSTPIVFRRIH